MKAQPGFDFYYDSGSCSLAVRIVLEEGGFGYRDHPVSAREPGKGTTSAAWLLRNPKGRVPALSPVAGQAGGEDGLLTEVPAILVYLARLRPEFDLMPSDPARGARAAEWMNWLSGWVHAVAFAQLWRPGRFSTDEAAFDGIRARGRAHILDAFAEIERIMADGRFWAVPDAYTAVDAYLIVFYRWGGLIGVMMRDYPAWTAATRRVLKRAAVQEAFRKDGLQIPCDSNEAQQS